MPEFHTRREDNLTHKKGFRNVLKAKTNYYGGKTVAHVIPARFIRRISVASNAFQTIDRSLDKLSHYLLFELQSTRQKLTYKTGLGFDRACYVV